MKPTHDNELRAIPDHKGYFVTPDGRIYSDRRRGKLKELSRFNIGPYSCCKVGHIHLRVHVALLLAFVGPKPAEHEGAFLDGDPNNLSLDNLQWMTRQRIVDGEKERGTLYQIDSETCPMRKLNAEQVIEIKERLGKGEMLRQIAPDFGVSLRTIGDIRLGRTWREVAA